LRVLSLGCSLITANATTSSSAREGLGPVTNRIDARIQPMAMIVRMRHRIGAKTCAGAFSLRLITADAVCQADRLISRTVERF
jgi:hypothetical protein